MIVGRVISSGRMSDRDMEISLEKLTLLVEEALERGYAGCQDLKQQEIVELFEKHDIKESISFRIWTVEELRKLPDGTVFDHLNRGRCWVMSKTSEKCMMFTNGTSESFYSNTDPWDKPMKLMER